jgi:cell division protease FtsH
MVGTDLEHLANEAALLAVRRAHQEPGRDAGGAGDRSLQLRQTEPARIKVATGGRTAEELVFGEETTGAEADIRRATDLARAMVGRFGMSDEIGFVSVLPQDGEAWAMPGLSQVSERTRRRVDEEIKRIVGEAHDEAARLLADNRDRLDALAEALIRDETLDEPEVYAAAGLEPPADVAPAPEASASTLSGAR